MSSYPAESSKIPQWSFAKSAVCACFFLLASLLVALCMIFLGVQSLVAVIFAVVFCGLSTFVGLCFLLEVFVGVFPKVKNSLLASKRKNLRRLVVLRKERRNLAIEQFLCSLKAPGEKDSSPKEVVVRNKSIDELLTLAKIAGIIWLFS